MVMSSWLNVAGFFRMLLLLKVLVSQLRHVSMIVIIWVRPKRCHTCQILPTDKTTRWLV